MTTQTPKLPTEAEWRNVFAYNPDVALGYIRERGLIAEEPVDPLLVEARCVAARCKRDIVGASTVVDKILAGKWDDHQLVVCALAALRRGMELAPRKELTLGEVISAVENNVNGLSYVIDHGGIHAALTEALQ